MSKFEKVLYILLLALMIFTLGVQIGIANGRSLQKAENARIQRMQEYLFKNCIGVER